MARYAKSVQPSRLPRRKGFRFWLGILLVTAGLGVMGSWLWSTFGSTLMLRGYQQVAIDEFVAGAGAFQGGIAETSTLVRDFEAFPPPQIDMDALANGEVFGLLTVPSWHEQTGISAELLRNRILVKQGGSTTAQSNRILNTGAAAHYTETAGPGEVGNFSLSAHRRSYGDNFLHLPALVEGDFVLLETAETWYIYRVIGEGFMVLPTETHVIDPDPFNPVLEDGTQRPTRRIMTLTTCTSANGGPWGNSHRWVVHLELDSWMPRSAGFPPMIDHYWTEEST